QDSYWRQSDIHVQSMVNEVLGSLLACFALTNEERFLDAAKSVSERLSSAYDDMSGMYVGTRNVISSESKLGICRILRILRSKNSMSLHPHLPGLSYPHLPSSVSQTDPIASLSEVGGQSLEFRYLSG